MRYTLLGARLVDATGERHDSAITVEDGRIVTVGPPVEAPGVELDARGSIVTPGLIDVHTHGGGGHDLQTTDPGEILAYARWAPTTGVTSFLTAVVGIPGGIPERQLETAAEAVRSHREGAQPVGIHMEGPYINVERRGAHDPSWLRLPDPAETERILELADGKLRLVTVAPELPGAPEMIRRLKDVGVTVSMGHTDATYEQALEAISLGVAHATHCFNAMRPMLHRAPGPIGAIVESPGVRGELILDGVHVHPAAMKALIRALGAERVIGVTDALSAAGVPDAVFTFNGRPARVVDGVARLEDGTITGSVLTMDQALRNVREMAGIPLTDAVRTLSLNPAESAGVADHKGLLAPGYDADLAVFDEELRLQATICRGEVAYAMGGWEERLRPMRRAS